MSLVANAQQFKVGKKANINAVGMNHAPAMASAIEGTDIWGYYMGSNINDFGGLGTGSAGSFRVAIFVPGDGVLAGAKIRGINLPALGAMTSVKAWVATGLANSKITVTKNASGITTGYNVVEFDEPIEIPAEGIYAGYTFTSNDAYPIAITGDDTPGGLFLATSATGTLQDYSAGGFGVSGLQVFVEGMVLPENGATVSSVNCEAAAKGAAGTATVNFVSNGSNGATSIGYTVTVNGVETTGTANVSVPGGLNKNGQFEVPFTAPDEIGAFPASVAITTVNGQPNELSTEPVAFTVNTVTRVVPRMTVVEEFTGTGCPWCTRGWAGMEAVKNNQSDKALVIAWHRYNNTDPMYQANYANIPFDGAPQCTVDRKVYPDPYYGDGNNSILDYVDMYNTATATADIINLKANFEDETNKKVIVTSNTEFLTNTKGYTIAFVLTADGLTGTTTAWKQANNYASYTLAQVEASIHPVFDEITEFPKVCKNGEYGKSSVALTFNDAMIGSTYNSSGKTLVPAFQTGNAGDIETSEYTLTMPTKTALLNALNYDKIYVTALVIDNKGQIANAARVRVLGAGQVDPIDIDGIKISDMEDDMQLMGEAMSPNAKYVVGMNFATYAPAVWNVENNEYTEYPDFEEGAFHAATSNGIFVGDDGNYAIKADENGNVTPLFFNEGEEVYNEEYDFYYSTGDAGSSAYAISEDGKVIAGFYFDSSYFTTPCIWNENNERINLPLPTSEEAGFEVNGGQVRYMTPDGKVLLGFLIDNMATWPACIWRQNETGGYDFDIICKNYWEEGYQQGKPYMVFNPSAISANGEWVALTIQNEFDDWDFSVPAPIMQAARLNLKSNTLEILNETEIAYTPTGIANDGTMLVYSGGNDMMGRSGYIWEAGKTEVKSLNDILVQVPALEELGSNTPCSITADGNYVQGFGINGENIFSYVVDYKNIVNGINSVNVENKPVSGTIYNIAGQRLAKMQKGLNIVNGKKYLVK